MLDQSFMELYRFIDASPNGKFGWVGLVESSPVDGPESDAQIATWRQELRECLAASKPFNPLPVADLDKALEDIIRTGQVSRENSRDLVIALRVLDSAFRGVHLGEVFHAHDNEMLVALRTRLQQGNPLFSSGDLHAFPKPRRLADPVLRGQEYLSDLLDVLTVVQLPPSFEIAYEPMLDVPRRRMEGVRSIGIIPTVHGFSELAWHQVGQYRYSVSEHLEAMATLQARLQAALDLLLARGIDLLLLPELVSGPELHASLMALLRQRTAAGGPMPLLVLAGTRMSPVGGLTRNRATILDPDGEQLWCQDKMHAYRFTQAEQAKAGYPLGNLELADRTEAIDIEPRKLVVADLTASLRLIVLTCEDFVAHQPYPQVISGMCATTLLVPIMSGGRASAAAQAWITDAAMKFVRHPGATSIVANSAALVTWEKTPDEWWHFGEIRSAPRVDVTWEGLAPDGLGEPIAWLATLDRKV
ncbi:MULTISPECIES: hypothetical protein [unclassified Xanthomonas]|uniref:hypothetical protein n=1 Tax=unclassified Xanthomonas TaxID=2643310 RepID=UPI0021E0505A|nr:MULTISPECIES: hypothetical protein [unclassified Xanthomonas]UYC22764.1 hypothetical protein NUG20_11025 [Xanthomonas sp. CFBP 8443]